MLNLDTLDYDRTVDLLQSMMEVSEVLFGFLLSSCLYYIHSVHKYIRSMVLFYSRDISLRNLRKKIWEKVRRVLGSKSSEGFEKWFGGFWAQKVRRVLRKGSEGFGLKGFLGNLGKVLRKLKVRDSLGNLGKVLRKLKVSYSAYHNYLYGMRCVLKLLAFVAVYQFMFFFI